MKAQKINALITTILVSFIVFATSGLNAQAVTVPTFPSCLNPQGTVKVHYANGVHGVPGSSEKFTGEDTVYYLTEDTLLQCLCPPGGTGIQTNWWKIPELLEQELEELKQNGWILVPNGAAWGLDEAQYLAKNTKYTCRSNNDGGDGGSSGGGNGSSGGNGGAGGGSGVSQGVGQILGLATTGNLVSIYGFSLLGIIFLSLSIFAGHAHSKKIN